MSSISTTVFAYGLTAIVSMFIAVLIKLMTTLLSNVQQLKGLTQIETTMANDGRHTSLLSVPATGDKTIVVIAAAVYAAMGSMVVKIVRIEEGRSLWAANGRLVHQTSHVLTRRPPYKAT